MFGRKKYKQGMADASKAYVDFSQKQVDAIDYVAKEERKHHEMVMSGLEELRGENQHIYDYMDSQQKAQLYSLHTPLDIKELGEEEKHFLVALLYCLAQDMMSHGKSLSEEQQNYIRAVQNYLEIRNPQLNDFNPNAVEEIESNKDQRAILQTVLEYLRLQGDDYYNQTELQAELFDSFSLSKKQYQSIVNNVEILYETTGALGLSEKYGYVPEEITKSIVEETEETLVVPQVQERILDSLFIKYGSNGYIIDCIDTDNFYLTRAYYDRWAPENNNIDYIDKNTGEIKTLVNIGRFFGTWKKSIVKIENVSDLIAYSEPEGIALHNLSDNSKKIIPEDHPQILCAREHYIIYTPSFGCESYKRVNVYDVLNGQTQCLELPINATQYYLGADISNNCLYLISGNSFNQRGDPQKRNFIISVVDLQNNCSLTTQHTINVKNGLSRYEHSTEKYRVDNLKVIGKFLYCFIENHQLGSEGQHCLIQVDLNTWSIKYLHPNEEGRRKHYGIISLSMYDDWIVYGAFDGDAYNHGPCSIEGIRISDGKNICLVSECAQRICPNETYLCIFARAGDWIYFMNTLNGNYNRINLNQPEEIKNLLE